MSMTPPRLPVPEDQNAMDDREAAPVPAIHE